MLGIFGSLGMLALFDMFRLLRTLDILGILANDRYKLNNNHICVISFVTMPSFFQMMFSCFGSYDRKQLLYSLKQSGLL